MRPAAWGRSTACVRRPLGLLPRWAARLHATGKAVASYLPAQCCFQSLLTTWFAAQLSVCPLLSSLPLPLLCSSTLIFIRVQMRVVGPVLLAVTAGVLVLVVIPSLRDSCWAAVDAQMGNLPVDLALTVSTVRVLQGCLLAFAHSQRAEGWTLSGFGRGGARAYVDWT